MILATGAPSANLAERRALSPVMVIARRTDLAHDFVWRTLTLSHVVEHAMGEALGARHF